MMDDHQGKMDMKMGYGRFAAMVATSTVVMFGLMYVNVYALGHIEFSQTRFWMAFVMGRHDGDHHAPLHVVDVQEQADECRNHRG
jgi:hypothetical protein